MESCCAQQVAGILLLLLSQNYLLPSSKEHIRDMSRQSPKIIYLDGQSPEDLLSPFHNNTFMKGAVRNLAIRSSQTWFAETQEVFALPQTGRGTDKDCQHHHQEE